MTKFMAPAVQTSPEHLLYNQQPPEYDLEALQAVTNTYRVVEGDPSLQKVGTIDAPDVQFAPSWYYPQFSTPQLVIAVPMSSPGVQLVPANWSQAVSDANKPKNALAATGVTTSLRAPGINEGM